MTRANEGPVASEGDLEFKGLWVPKMVLLVAEGQGVYFVS